MFSLKTQIDSYNFNYLGTIRYINISDCTKNIAKQKIKFIIDYNRKKKENSHNLQVTIHLIIIRDMSTTLIVNLSNTLNLIAASY